MADANPFVFLYYVYALYTLFGFQKDLVNSRIIAYISNLPVSIRIDVTHFPKEEKMVKFPPTMPPKAVPLLVMQAKVAQKVVSISRFSKEKTREPKRNTRK